MTLGQNQYTTVVTKGSCLFPTLCHFLNDTQFRIKESQDCYQWWVGKDTGKDGRDLFWSSVKDRAWRD